jgi:tetratricopeptide (TPR) repeat protein
MLVGILNVQTPLAKAEDVCGSYSRANVISSGTRLANSVKPEGGSKLPAGEARRLTVEGKKLLSDGHYREAEEVFRKAVVADEACVDCHLNYGICLYQLNRYWGALSQLEKVIALDKDNAQALLYLGHCYSKTKKISDAVRSYENYLELNTTDAEADKYRTLVGVLKTQAQSLEQSQAAKQSTASGDYMKEATSAGLYRWPESRMPITVFIEPGEAVNGYRPEFDDCLRHAFQEWTTTTKSKVRFDVVNDRDGAEMIVTWTDDMHAPELRAEAGKANVTQDSDGIRSADLKLLTVSPFKEGPLGSEALYRVCLHEIGHALGIIGHSPYPDDIMYPLLSDQSGITPRDAKTFFAVYAAAEESLAVANGEAKTSDESEFSRLSPVNQAALLLKIGTKAVFAGKYAESITSLEKALQLDPTNKLAKSNLSVAANNLALQVENKDERLKLLHKAMYWNPDSDSGRINLNNLLKAMDINPDDANARIKLADKLESENDLIGACAELSESAHLKPNSKVTDRVQALRKKLGYSD